MPTTEASRKAVAKYTKENYGRIEFQVPKEYKERIKERAKEKDLSVNAYLFDLVKKDIEKE